MQFPSAAQLAKLPKWAQEHIADLHREIERERRNVSDASLHKVVKGAPGLKTFQTDLNNEFVLPMYAWVKMYTGEHFTDCITLSMQRDHDGQYFVNADALGRNLIIVPQAGNTVNLYNEARK